MRHGRDTSGDRQRRRELEAQTRLRTHLAVTRVLAEAGSLAEAAPEVLAAICRRLGWELGALWTIDRDAGVLRCVDLWHVPDSPLVGFAIASRQAVFPPGEGLPGRVWEEQAARWVPDVLHGVETRRSASAAREGVRSALAFPIESRGAVLGVMEFFSAEARAPDQDLIDMLSGIGSQVGQFVSRREAEREVRVSEARKSAIVNAALDCIVSIDADGRITEFNPAAEKTFGYNRDQALGKPLAGLLIPD